MTRLLHRLGGTAAAHPWRTICAWLLLAVALTGAAVTFGGETQENWDVPDARAQAGIEQLRDHFPAMSGSSAQVLVNAPGGAARPSTVLDRTQRALADLEHVSAVPPPRLSEDADTALFTVLYDVPTTHRDLLGDVEPLEDATAPTVDAGYLDLAVLPDAATEPTRRPVHHTRTIHVIVLHGYSRNNYSDPLSR